MKKKITNCVFVGLNAGEDISEGDRIVIIGDNVRSLDQRQNNVVFLGDKVAIGEKLFGVPINVAKIINNYLRDGN